MKFRYQLLLLASLIVSIKSVRAQEIKSHNFNELEPILHYQNDTTYVINFWAMWCKPCVEELPEFEDIRKDYTDKKVKVILVSLDFGKNTEDRLAGFLKKKNINAEVVLLDDPDADNWIGKVAKDWDGALPATLIYKKDERIVFTRQISYDELVRSIDKLNNQAN
ncbi:TlpA disulfide reductase family protein [Labilibaculum sp. K2S]|uniref:TlpA disulfide reductase family protein n=1 Tax=Labilibaculum sp. K2S TaxID=3056386 RepID=UPI0025A312E3|nr:TlpA disulfide reductase family protein [Labilibaculum sp. K2S]MDM8158188.1 TlpA disulfide reductase family protein [Labilibaculum sp. K2S]